MSQTSQQTDTDSLNGMWWIIAFGCIIALVTYGPRAAMGFYLTPVSNEYSWGRDIFSLAIAIQNLVWGLGQPFAGMIADRYGTARVLTGGAILYALGLVLMAHTADPFSMQISAGVLVGLGISGSAFLMVLAAFARLLPEGMRPLAYGFGTAAGSAGQFIFAPLSQGAIDAYGWQVSLYIMAAFLLIVPILAVALKGKPKPVPMRPGEADQSVLEALQEAFGHRSYVLLVTGFFVCGFQLSFITTHLPAYVSDVGIPATYGAVAIALIGLFNIAGSITSGVLCRRMPKRYLLAAIYLLRAGLIAVFLLLPPSIGSLLFFSAAMGFLWLSTIPPTQQLVAIMFGTRYVATLFGFVFFSHQFGSFVGIWLGGELYEATGSYDIVWLLSIALGIGAALVHLPIVERQVARPALAN